MVVCNCNPSAEKIETGTSMGAFWLASQVEKVNKVNGN